MTKNPNTLRRCLVVFQIIIDVLRYETKSTQQEQDPTMSPSVQFYPAHPNCNAVWITDPRQLLQQYPDQTLAFSSFFEKKEH